VVDFRILVPDGIRWISIHGEGVYDPQGLPLRLVGMQVDVTEGKRAQEALERANRELEQFAYVASHDLQEPLRMVASYLGLLQRTSGGALDEGGQRCIAFALDGAKRMQRMVRALLEFARLDAGELQRERVEVQHVVAEVLHDLSVRIEETGARIEVGEMPVVYAQRDHLVRLLLNLVGNALKYRREGVAPAIAVAAQRHGHEWIFAISDEGVGIPSEQHQRVFELFQRLPHGAGEPGNGIGLAICRKIVERHGGRIWLVSEPGKGSTFSFSLPAFLPEPA
jgi:light-regulated signal transduction histidine kinase (bacteriophytochrome)